MNHMQAVITSVQGEATSLPALVSRLKFPSWPQRLTAHFPFMAHCSTRAVPIVLLVFGLAAILLLTVPTEDIQEAPGFRVRPVRLGIFGATLAWV